MQYTTEIIINKPRIEVVALFENSDNLKHWMKGLQSLESIEGIHGEKGAKSRLIFLNGKRKIEMKETILKNKLPSTLSAAYELNGVYNTVQNHFQIFTPETTLYTTKHSFKFDSFGMKVLAFLVPGIFKKQSQRYMQDFKVFAENQ